MHRLIPVVAILIALGLFFGYINPTMGSEIATLRQEIDAYNNALQAAERFRQKQAELTEARANIPAEGVVRLESMLPDGVDNVQLILDLDALASRTGLTLQGFDTVDAGDEPEDEFSNPGPVDFIELSTTGKGTYENFRAFLEATELSLRPIDLQELSIRTADSGEHTYNMTFHLYWLR